MRRIFTTLVLFLFVGFSAMSQTPLAYQMLVRDNSGRLMHNANIGVKVSILQGSDTGMIAYQEVHNVKSNAEGLVTLKVGTGKMVGGDFSALSWPTETYYMRTEVDPAGGTAYSQSFTQLIWRAPVANFATNAVNASSISWDQLLNKPVLFSGEYDSLTNKPILFNGNYNSLNNVPSIKDSIYKILVDSAYLRSYTEIQYLSQAGDVIYLMGGDSVSSITLPPATFDGDYENVNNRPDISALTAQALADSGYLKSYTETQQLSINGDTIYLTDGGSAVVPFEIPDLSVFVLSSDTDQTILGTKIFEDTILVPTRMDAAWNLLGNSAQAVNYEAMNFVIDSLKNLIADMERGLYAPIVYTTGIDSSTFPLRMMTGEVASNGLGTLSARGFCYSLNPEPTIDDDVVTAPEAKVGTYSLQIGPLVKDTVYFVRAFASNEYGVNYGNQFVFYTPRKPVVETNAMGEMLGNIASANGNVISDGGNAVINRGFCWNTTGNPTLSDEFESKGGGNGPFGTTITGLTPSTTYYIRAYAINGVDTAYGDEVVFTTTAVVDGAPCSGADSIQDYEGNWYKTIKLGNQCWMKENLRTGYYSDGTYISSTTSTNSTVAYYCYPGESNGTIYYDADSIRKYGLLYNWTAATRGYTSSSVPSTVEGVCPSGWHLPSLAEFDTLKAHVAKYYSCIDSTSNFYYRLDIESCPTCYPYYDEEGNLKYYTVDDFQWLYYEYCDDYTCSPMYCGYDGCGEMAKVPGSTIVNNLRALVISNWGRSSGYTQYLTNETVNKNNASGFSAVPAGYRYSSSSYGMQGIRNLGYLWASDAASSSTSGSNVYFYDSSTDLGKTSSARYNFCSVRCVKN